jgi:hypothetical protein
MTYGSLSHWLRLEDYCLLHHSAHNLIGMEVLFAYYGVSCAGGQLRWAVQDRSTRWAAKLCNGKTSCNGMVNTGDLTDPYYGCGKDFIIIAACNDNVVAALVRPEANQQRFHLAC